MNDGPSNNSNSLREEWSLLVHSFLDQPEDQKLNPKELTLPQIETIKKELSLQRQSLNQKIEAIKKQIDEQRAVIENLELVGSDTSDTVAEIDYLHLEGEKMSTEIFRIENKLNKLRELNEQVSLLQQEA